MLRLPTGDQHRRRDQQIEAPELLVSGDVLQRLAGRAALKCFVVMIELTAGEFHFGMSVKIGLIAPKHVHHERLRVETSVSPRSGLQTFGAFSDCEIEPQGSFPQTATVSCLSFSA